jgi:chromosomal replication initiator protein
MNDIDTHVLWQSALIEIELNLSKTTFATWFKNTHIINITEGTVRVGVANEFIRDWLLSKHHKLITKTLRDLCEHVRTVEYTISKGDPHVQKILGSEKKVPEQNQVLFSENVHIREDGLNPKYTFESFVVGPFNELAYVAAQSIIQSPGTLYNPFFVHGSTGLGKTHIIQSVGNAIKTKHPYKKVFYTSLEKFSSEYVQSVNTNKSAQFKERYKKFDVLIIDDIQFIKGKEKTQEELFHIFNSLYDFNKQIIFSSDKHPNFIAGLEDRLKSRFNAGMIVDIANPEFESRLAVLKAKTADSAVFISDDVLSFVAEHVEGNIRELEGVLNLVQIQTQVRGRMLYTHEVKSLIKNNISQKKNLSVKEVIQVVAEYYSITEEMLHKKSRKKEIVHPRQVAMYILREVYDISYPSIGEKFDGRDHTTVMHSVEKVKKDLLTDKKLQDDIEELRTICV